MTLWFSAAPSLFACEGCKGPSNVNGGSGVAGIGFGFSMSVLFMLAMVVGIVGGMIWMIARTCRQLQNHHQPIVARSET
jgi:hypothetical protein